MTFFSQHELKDGVGKVAFLQLCWVMFSIVGKIIVLINIEVVLSIAGSSDPTFSLFYGAVRRKTFLCLHELKIRVKCSPPRHPRVDDILQLPEGE